MGHCCAENYTVYKDVWRNTLFSSKVFSSSEIVQGCEIMISLGEIKQKQMIIKIHSIIKASLPNVLLLIWDFTLSIPLCSSVLDILQNIYLFSKLKQTNNEKYFRMLLSNSHLYLFIVILYSINLSLIWDIRYGYSIQKNRILFLPLKKICLVSPCLLFFIPEISSSIPSMDETLINAIHSLMCSWEELWERSITILES